MSQYIGIVSLPIILGYGEVQVYRGCYDKGTEVSDSDPKNDTVSGRFLKDIFKKNYLPSVN